MRNAVGLLILFAFCSVNAQFSSKVYATIPDSSQNKITDINLFRQNLSSSEWVERYGAASNICPLSQNDTISAINSLFDAIQNELDSPISKEMRSGSYSTISDMLKCQYVFALIRLGGAEALVLKLRAKNSTGEFQNWLLLSLAFLKDRDAMSKIKSLLSEDCNGQLRAMAVRALASNKDPADTTLFKSLLADKYSVIMRLDHDVPDGDFQQVIFPVRDQAAAALRGIGFIVKIDSLGNYTIERNK